MNFIYDYPLRFIACALFGSVAFSYFFDGDHKGIFIALTLFIVTASGYVYEKLRAQKLVKIAKKLGFDYSKKVKDYTKLKHENFELFCAGGSKTFKNEMWKFKDDIYTSIFDFSYTQTFGKDKRTCNQSVLSVDSRHFNFPRFQLRPKTFINKIIEAFGAQDINFESFPIFSKNYTLTGNNETEIRELFSPEVIKFFESHISTFVEAEGSVLIYYKHGIRCKPEDFGSFYESAELALSILIKIDNLKTK